MPSPNEETAALTRVSDAEDLIEWYYRQGYSDGLPLVPPTPAKIDAMVKAHMGSASHQLHTAA